MGNSDTIYKMIAWRDICFDFLFFYHMIIIFSWQCTETVYGALFFVIIFVCVIFFYIYNFDYYLPNYHYRIQTLQHANYKDFEKKIKFDYFVLYKMNFKTS